MKFFLLIILSLGGCCIKRVPPVEPEYPKDVSGWKLKKELHYYVLGEFVLKKGQATDNGKLSIKLIDLLEGECIDAPFSEQRRFIVQFSRVPSGEVLCEDEYLGTGAIGRKGDCKGKLDEFGIWDVRGKKVNVKDDWVHFDISGYPIN